MLYARELNKRLNFEDFCRESMAELRGSVVEVREVVFQGESGEVVAKPECERAEICRTCL